MGGTIVAGGITQTGTFNLGSSVKSKVQNELRKALEVLILNKVDLIICEYFRNILEMEWAIEVALEYGIPVAATMCIGPGGDESGVGVGECTVRRAMAEELADIRGGLPVASNKSDHDLAIHRSLEEKGLKRYKNKGCLDYWMEYQPATGRPLSTAVC